MELKLDMIQTLALAIVAYYLGSWLKKKVNFLEKFCIPSPVVGGLIFSILTLILKEAGLGTMGLSVFLSMALISLKLWELKAVAGPLLIILLAQTVLMAAFAYFVTFKLCGKNFDAAVLAAGHCGFGMGATPNAMANMDAVTSRFGPSPTAYLVIPIVGAFLVDFMNLGVITAFVNML